MAPDDRLLDVGVSQSCRRLTRHSLVASALESEDELVCAGVDVSDAASSTPSLRLVTGVRGRLFADLRTDSIFCLGGSQNSGSRFMCPIVAMGPNARDCAVFRVCACHSACLQWQLRSPPSLSGKGRIHAARRVCVPRVWCKGGCIYTPFLSKRRTDVRLFPPRDWRPGGYPPRY